jgi:hypothetical protein
MTRKMTILTCLLAVSVVTVTGCSKKVNEENYNKIKPGMTLDEVEEILGSGDVMKSASIDVDGEGSGGSSGNGASAGAKWIQWKDGEKVIRVGFINDRVATFQKSGF